MNLDSRKLYMDQTPAHPELDCMCHLHWSIRRAKIQALCARVEARLDLAVIEERIKQDDQSWYMLFFRAKCIREQDAENSNSERETMRPPRMVAGV